MLTVGRSRWRLGTTEEDIRQPGETIASYLDLLERAAAFYVADGTSDMREADVGLLLKYLDRR